MLRTVHAKLLIPILAILLIGGIIIVIIGQYAASNVIHDAFREDGQRSVSNLRFTLDREVLRAQTDLLALSFAPSVKELLAGNRTLEDIVGGYIKELIEINDIYHSIEILNTDGIIEATTVSANRRGYRGDREFFITNMQGEQFISRDVEMNREIGRFTLSLSIPIYDEGYETIIGAALTIIRLDKINSRYVEPVSLLGNHGYAMVVTGDGLIIANHDAAQSIAISQGSGRRANPTVLPDNIIDLLLETTVENNTFEATMDKVDYVIFAEKSNLTGWYAVVFCPLNEFNEQSNFLALINTLLLSIMIIIQAIIIWFVVREITKALTTTVKYSEAVSKGELDCELSLERKDEVGILAQSLRDMVAKLKGMIVKAEESSKTIKESINYASKIQQNLLPDKSVFEKAFSDFSVIWEPRDVVGGDIYWAKNFDDGTVICVCDCTGHGTPGALLTMLVVSAFETIITENMHTDTAEILYLLDQRLVAVMNVNKKDDLKYGIKDVNDGCDLAVLFVSKDKTITMSAGNISVLVCDGKEVKRYKGQPVFIGEGKLDSKNEIKVHTIPANPDNKFYIASDGLPDQIGGDRIKQFGFKTIERLILENHQETQAVISQKIWESFMDHKGEQTTRDDIELISFKP